MSRAYYNEIDKFAAAWLRELIKAGAIAPGDVDERDIRDVQPSDLEGYTQCHFFAGIGVWSYALRNAGWPDNRPVWTGSCPCQPFSAAGGRSGFADDRHLWPHWFHLISKRRPAVCFGEQVASKDGLAWLDIVHNHMEAADYAFAAVDTCSAGVGAPHIRQRLRFAAHAGRDGQLRSAQPYSGSVQPEQQAPRRANDAGRCLVGALAHGESQRRAGRPDDEDGRRGQLASGRDGTVGGLAHHHHHPGLEEFGVEPARSECATAERSGAACQLADASSSRHDRGRASVASAQDGPIEPQRQGAAGGPTNGFWRDAEWIFCTDQKWRAVEPGAFPLAHGAPAHVGRLRGYGNAVDAEATRVFIEAYIEARTLEDLF